MATETPIKIQIVKTLSTASPSRIVAVKADGDNAFSLFVTDKTGIPYPLKDLQNNIIITNTDGNLQITSSSTSTNINLASSILATINSALQNGDNISELINDVNYITLADIPTFVASDYDLDNFTNTSGDPFARISDLSGIATNLEYVASPTQGTVTSDTGTDAIIPIADFNNAGLLSSIEKKQLTTNTSTGVFTFTGLVKTSNTQFSIGAATGIIVDSGLNYQVNYAGSTGNTTPYLTTADSTFVLIKNDNTILLQSTFPTPEQRRENIYIGKVIHPDRTNILNVNNTVDFVYSPMSALRDLWSPLKLINDGVLVTPNGSNLKINTSKGNLFGNGINFTVNPLSPNNLEIAATVQSTFMYRTRVGGVFLNTTDLDPSYYDVSGVRTLIPGANSRATNQRVYLFPTGQLRIQYGQQWYTSLTTAIAGIETEVFVEYLNHKDNAILIGIISLVKNATNLTDITDARFNFVSKWGELSGGTGGLSTTTLQQAYNNSVTPEITTDTTLGAVTIKRGSASDTDNVFEVQNGVGTNTASIAGDGALTALSYNGYTPENIENKQNDLTPDGTGTKYPTVDAVNSLKWIKSNESLTLAQRKGDVLYGIIDKYTGEEITLSKVTGTPTVDSVIYFQLGSEYFKRVYEEINLDWFGSDVNMETFLNSQANTYIIRNQLDFNGINAIINANATSKFYLKSGNYYYNDNHIILNAVDGKDVLITSINGQTPTLISNGDNYTIGDATSTFSSHYKSNVKNLTTDFRTVTFLDENNNFIEKSNTGIYTVGSAVTIHDSGTKVGKFLLPTELSYLFNRDNTYFKDSTLRLSSLWMMKLCGISHTDIDGYIYFYYTGDDSNFAINFNNNNLQLGKFSIDNVYSDELLNGITVYDGEIYIPNTIKKLHINEKTRFASLTDCGNSNFEVSNLEFNGSAIFQNNTFGAELPTFSFNGSENAIFKNNTFKNLGGKVFNFDTTNFVTVTKNKFFNKNTIGVLYGNNVSFSENIVESDGLLKLEPVVYMLGENMLISGNTFKNTLYNSVQIANGNRATRPVSGLVSKNLIYNTHDFNNKQSFTFYDGGAIYVNNLHSGVVNVVDNVIHDIEGGYNSGIYLDDGCSNVTITNNLIYNTGGLSVSARQSENDPINSTVDACTNIVINNNILGSFPWIGTSDVGNGCTFQNNLLLSPNENYKTNTFNSYLGAVTVMNYNVSGNRYTPFSIRNNKVSLNDLFHTTRSSFVNNFMSNDYPNSDFGQVITSAKQSRENVTYVGGVNSYSTGSNYSKIKLYFSNKITDVNANFKMRVSYGTFDEVYLFRLAGGSISVRRLSDLSLTSLKNEKSVYQIKYKIIAVSGVYNSHLELYIRHTNVGSVYYNFFDVMPVGDVPNLLDNNLFVSYQNTVNTLPGDVVSLANGFPNKVSGTTAERPDGNYYIRNGYTYYNTDTNKTEVYTQTGVGTFAWVVYANISQTITNGITNSAPSEDVVFDALTLKANLTSPTLTGAPTAPTAPTGTNTTQIATTAFAQGIRPYKVYTALLTQVGTNAPTAIVLENTIGAIVWSRTVVGGYFATLSGAFTTDKTSVLITNGSANSTYIHGAQVSASNVNVITLADGQIDKATIEIRVYN